jgi:hypothetical protein
MGKVSFFQDHSLLFLTSCVNACLDGILEF